MRKSIILLFVIGIFVGSPINAQFGKLLNKVSKSVANEITGKTDDSQKPANNQPEPKCACDQAVVILDLGGGLKLDYSEISISLRADGAILVKDRMSDNYYIARDGKTEGPIKAGDPRLSGFESNDDEKTSDEKTFKWEDSPYVTRSGEKYLIKFDGKSYGPYSVIRQFKASSLKDKFAAEVIENVPVSEAEGKKMDEAIKNAKTEEERNQLAIQYAQEMGRKMQEGGGPMAAMPKIVTNIPGVTYDPLKSMGGSLNSTVKYNDIVVTTYDKIMDLSNKVLINLKPESQNAQNLFVNSSNSKYAWYKYGTLTFGDGQVLTEMFNPHFVKINGVVSIAYMYYSPKRNSIMQCTIPF
jgi:hypothetical protein